MKKIILIVLALLLIVGLGIGLSLRRAGAPTVTQDELTATSTAATTTTVVSPLPKPTPGIRSDKDRAWDLFQKYLQAAKDHDLATVKSLSYQVSPDCFDAAKTKECNARMDTAYYYGSAIEKSSLTHVVGDAKQLILVGDYKEKIDEEAITLTRRIVYFTKQDGDIKFLSLSPFDGFFKLIVAGSADATSTTETRLKALIVDTDMDIAPDAIETCTDPGAPADCAKTDPNKKDSNGNGWWDSIEALFYKK
ncbi:hypothetical protein KW800_02350 [Candidatus Parcubacteria bacterium]|nr:hypothetical protein [Candidatus Parcubacteria bacterium]